MRARVWIARCRGGLAALKRMPHRCTRESASSLRSGDRACAVGSGRQPISRHCLSVTLGVAAMVTVGGCATGSTGHGGTRVTIDDARWYVDGKIVNPGSAAEGLLMNVRMVNSVFEDEGDAGGAHLGDFDPEENTSRFIRRIPDYVAAGVNAFTISLQGGMPGYEGAVNSAFNADGTLREPYLARVARVIEAADRHGAVVILSCFYQRQHSHPRALRGRQAVLNAVEEVARWVAQRGYSNVLLEVANEYAHSGYGSWADSEWLRSPAGQVELMERARTIAPGLLVSTSGMGNGTIAPLIAEAADFVLLHLNTTSVDEIPARIRLAHGYGKPVVVNEDDKLGAEGARAAAHAVASDAGWGFMHMEKNQHAPFEFDGRDDDSLVYEALTSMTKPGAVIAGADHALPVTRSDTAAATSRP